MCPPSYTCSTCGKTFGLKHNLIRHQRNIHAKDKEVFICNECNISCRSKRQFHKHWKSVHSSTTRKKRNFVKICPLCKCEERNIQKHFTDVHNIEFNEESLVFDNLKSFHTWKKDIEKKSLSKYILKNLDKGVNVVKKYVCNRNGFYQSKSSGKRHLKTQGSRKINAFCPASMIVTISSEVCVKFINCHVGHDHEIAHFNISPSKKEIIAGKLINKVPKMCILDEIRDSCDGVEIFREDLINTKDINNIAAKYNISEDFKKDKNDAVSVSITIAELQKEHGSFVRFFKPQDTLNENYTFLKEEDFVLILMNSAQCDILKLYGNNIICADDTHGIGYEFYLFTILVIDNYHQGFPCSFMISNRKDTAILELFYRVIESTAGKIKPKVFMSDMASEIYNAWRNVMGPVELRLFCSWHVLKAWRENIKKVKDGEKQKTVFKYLNTILYELDENKFNLLLDDAMSMFKNDPDCQDFYVYFAQNYEKIAANWAYCYRKHSGINTNMSLERLHRTLKYLYFQGKKMNRLDKSIYLLLKFARDKLFDRLITLHKGKVSTKLKILRSRHPQFTSVQVTCEKDNNFESFLVTSDSNVYHVVLCNDTCTCKLICDECKSCLHKYCCGCLDNTIKFNMCKHIHAVCQFVNDQRVQEINNNQILGANNENLLDVTEEVTNGKHVSNNPEEMAILKEIKMRKQADVDDQEVQRMFEDVANIVKNNSSFRADFYQILKNAKQKYEIQIKTNDMIVEAGKEAKDVSIPAPVSNKNIEKQRRLFATKKSRKKKEDHLEKCNPQECEDIFMKCIS